MKLGVVIFPGSNCDRDTLYVLENIYELETVPLWHKDTDIQQCDMIFLPGGFSYGDYLRSGAIARFSPIMEKIIEFANNGGYVMGICNGFQILCEAHLLPGALLHNNSRKFVCKNVFIRSETNHSFLTSGIPSEKILKIPVAHAEGRYFIQSDQLEELKQNDQILFKYCDADGTINETSNFNGSIENIAAICNKKRNVFGMMPHPERASDPLLGNTDGQFIFNSVFKELAAKLQLDD